MSHLVLELRAGETMMVNGATIRFRNKCRLELVSQARFLFGKQLMEEADIRTPLEQLYYRLQTAYVGGTEHAADPSFEEAARDLPPAEREQLASVRHRFVDGDHYRALKLLRALIERDRALSPAP